MRAKHTEANPVVLPLSYLTRLMIVPRAIKNRDKHIGKTPYDVTPPTSEETERQEAIARANRKDATIRAQSRQLDVTRAKLQRGRIIRAKNAKDDAEADRKKLREAIMKYFSDVVNLEPGETVREQLEKYSPAQLKKEYEYARIAKGLIDDERDYFEDGCPYSLSTLEDREVGLALKHLIGEGKLPPRPRPRRRRARQK